MVSLIEEVVVIFEGISQWFAPERTITISQKKNHFFTAK
jgi:hypothetical protein